MDRDTFCRNLKRNRILAGFTQKALSDKLGVTQATISAWETGYRTPDFNSIALLAETLGVSLDAIADLSTDSGVLSLEDKELLSHFHGLSPDDRQAVIAMVDALKRAKSLKEIA